jgi:dipeptidyl aminopeptidase/acylaminoacyl peptidase
MLRLFIALTAVGLLLAAGTIRAEPPPLEAYGKPPAMELPTLSPSGQRIASIEVVDGTRLLVARLVDGARPLFQTKVGEAKILDVEWGGEDHLFVTVSKTTSLGFSYTTPVAELETMVSVNLNNGRILGTFDNQGLAASAAVGDFGVLTRGRHWYGYYVGIAGELARVDLDTGERDAVRPARDGVDEWLLNAHGDVIARSFYDERDGDWRVLAGALSGESLASGRDPYSGADLWAMGRSPNSVLIGFRTSKGYLYEEAPLSGAQAKPLEDSDDIAEILVDTSTRQWIGQVMNGDTQRVAMLDPRLEAKVSGALDGFSGRTANLESWSADFSRMIVHTSGGADPGTYWLVDGQKGVTAAIGHDFPEIEPADIGPVRMVGWKAADGLALRGVLTLPPGRDPHNLPVVVMPHGGPEDRDYPAFDWWAQAFASRGYAVFQPNFRGSSGYGQAFRDAGFGQWGRKMQTDVSDGLAELARQGVVDPRRACIVGASYGGYVALAGVTVQHGLYRCAASVAGVSDPGRFLRGTKHASGGVTDSDVRYWEAYMGAGSTSDPTLAAISPVKHAAEADAPILLIHGKNDTVVPVDESYAMQTALKAAGKPFDLLLLPNEDHWLSSEATRIEMLKATVAFVEKYNPPDPAAAQAVAAVAQR